MLANKPHALRLFCDLIAEYDTETVREIIEQISPEKIVPDNREPPSEFLRMSASLAFRLNDFPEAVSNPFDNGADIHALSDTWIGEYLSRRGKRTMSENFQRAKFMAEVFREHNPSDIISSKNTRPYDGWEKKLAGSLSCHLLSHLWEMIESGTDNGGKWVNVNTSLRFLRLEADFCYFSIISRTA